MQMIQRKYPVLVLGTMLFLGAAVFRGRADAGENEVLVSSLELMDAVGAIDGIRVSPANDVPVRTYAEDYGPTRMLEIVRPDMGPITVSRLGTTCSCIRATMGKKSFGQGERAFVEIRNVKPSVPDGAEYGVFVLLNSPYRVPLQAEVFVKSDRAPAAAAE